MTLSGFFSVICIYFIISLKNSAEVIKKKLKDISCQVIEGYSVITQDKTIF